jgi:hypothetical protein
MRTVSAFSDVMQAILRFYLRCLVYLLVVWASFFHSARLVIEAGRNPQPGTVIGVARRGLFCGSRGLLISTPPSRVAVSNFSQACFIQHEDATYRSYPFCRITHGRMRLKPQKTDSPDLDALLQLTLAPEQAHSAITHVANLDDAGYNRLVGLAGANHVVMRAFRVIARQDDDPRLADMAAQELAREEQRIDNALTFLLHICDELEHAGCATVVMKSLDHWPDLGSDLDLYTSAEPGRVIQVMLRRLDARIAARSWGDRIAGKWNFIVPGLPEPVEVHARRLGQTGEHAAIAKRLIAGRIPKMVNGRIFLVPSPEERIIVATLQRMYRHFYFRVCDIVDTLELLESGQLDYTELKQASELGGIWLGVATYLRIVHDYVLQYRGAGPDLPPKALHEARFGGGAVRADGKFLRVPIVPNSAHLYIRQMTNTALRGDVAATLRLALLPWIASLAAVAFRITGSDKGIW